MKLTHLLKLNFKISNFRIFGNFGAQFRKFLRKKFLILKISVKNRGFSSKMFDLFHFETLKFSTTTKGLKSLIRSSIVLVQLN